MYTSFIIIVIIITAILLVFIYLFAISRAAPSRRREVPRLGVELEL